MAVDRLLGDRVEVVVARWNVRGVVRAGDIVVDAAHATLDFVHVRRQVATVDENPGARILQHVRGLARGEPKIERHGNGAQQLAREIRRNRVLRRRDIEGDTIARPHAEVGKPLREAIFAPPNNAKRFFDPKPSEAIVQTMATRTMADGM